MIRLGVVCVALAVMAACSPVPAPTPPASPHLAVQPARMAEPIAHRVGFPEQAALSVDERDALERGVLIPRRMRFTGAGKEYVGGVAYQLVRATPAQVLGSLEHSPNLEHVFPVTKDVTEVARHQGVKSLRVTHGKGFVTVAYTVDVTRDDEAYRFWMDDEQHHDIRDVWGYLRVTPYDAERSLITVGVALDLGPGIVRTLFESSVRDGMLSTAGRIRNFVEQEWIPAGQNVVASGDSVGPQRTSMLESGF